MISPETQAPHWEWYYIAMYFYIGGIAAGAYFIGSLLELLNRENLRSISKTAYYIAFPLICITPILLIADLGRPFRFWHLFFYTKDAAPYMNHTSPLSVGTWALLVFGGMSFLSFVNVLAEDGRLTSPGLKKFHVLFSRIPHKIYAAIGSFFGFFVAGYTGVLLNTTARPLWEATDPLVGSLFVASAASTGAAAIVLFMLNRKAGTSETFGRLEAFDRVAMIIEIALIAVMLVVAGKYAAPLLTGFYGVLFLGGTVLVGILIPLWLNWKGFKPGAAGGSMATLVAVLVLFGGLMLRISLVQAGQM
ncbi:MAG: polysulfide reductase NrfD [Nitrospiraceae bacterium]|nr:polysulfide reductase NrfD [Nitrospiraceae bacterium]